jgi:hypothetical protein
MEIYDEGTKKAGVVVHPKPLKKESSFPSTIYPRRLKNENKIIPG